MRLHCMDRDHSGGRRERGEERRERRTGSLFRSSPFPLRPSELQSTPDIDPTPPATSPMPPQFTYTRRVRFADTDVAGIVHFSNFYRFMEEAEHEYFRSLGLKIMDYRPDGTAGGWPRVRASCTFESPA